MVDVSGCDHISLFGRTGSGKTTLLYNALAQLIHHNHGLTLIDPDNDTAEAVAKHCVEHRESFAPIRFADITYVKPTEECFPCLDPFSEYENLHTRIEQVNEIICRQVEQADMKETRRMYRVLSCVLWFTAVKVKGKHLGLGRAWEFCTFEGDKWHAFFRRIKNQLPDDVRENCIRIASLNPSARRQETESTLNILTMLLSGPIIKQMLSPGIPVDFHRVVRRNQVMIWNLGVSPSLTRQQRDVIASFVFIQLFEACFYERNQHHLVIEEARRVLGHDLREMFTMARRRKLNIWYCDQGLASQRHERVDVSNEALGQPGTVISFQQQSNEELKIFAPFFTNSVMNFEQKYEPMDRPDGYQLIQLPEYGHSTSVSDGNTISSGTEEGEQTGFETGEGFRSGASSEESREQSRQKTQRSQKSVTNQTNEGFDVSNDGENLREIARQGETRIEGETTGNDVSQGNSIRNGQSRSTSNERNLSRRHGVSRKATRSDSESRTISRQEIETLKNHLLPKHKTEWYPKGMLYDCNTQIHMMKQILQLLDIGEFLIFRKGKPTVKSKGYYLEPAFVGAERWGEYALKKAVERMQQINPFLGGSATTPSATSSVTPRTSGNGSGQASSPITRLLGGGPTSSKNGRDGESGTSAESS